MAELLFKVAKETDVCLIKQLINEMYGIEYEVREERAIAQEISNNKEVYVLAYQDDKCLGFAGASINNNYYKEFMMEDRAVLDYIYTKEGERRIDLAFGLIKELIQNLLMMNIKSAIMQVQTFNKQRFFHYALSDKKIIKTQSCERNGKKYDDMILLIENLEDLSKITIKEFMIKAIKYKTEG